VCVLHRLRGHTCVCVLCKLQVCIAGARSGRALTRGFVLKRTCGRAFASSTWLAIAPSGDAVLRLVAKCAVHLCRCLVEVVSACLRPTRACMYVCGCAG
jgi:hypothetical protein